MNPDSKPHHHKPTEQELLDPLAHEGDHIVTVIRRHPFGLAVQYLAVIFGLALSYWLIFWSLPGVNNEATLERNQTLLSVSAVVVSAASALLLLIGTALYRQNRWVVTDDNITQVLRKGIFGTHVSSLAMANIENISSERQGIFTHIFNFGTLEIETAGEQANKFNFIYCPRPETYVKILLEAHEQFVKEHPEAGAHSIKPPVTDPGSLPK